MAAGTIRNWKMAEVQKYCNMMGPKIRDMALKGDGIALAVFNAYNECYRTQAPDGSPMNLTLRDALNDFFLREVNIKDQERNANKFGLNIPNSIN